MLYGSWHGMDVVRNDILFTWCWPRSECGMERKTWATPTKNVPPTSKTARIEKQKGKIVPDIVATEVGLLLGL